MDAYFLTPKGAQRLEGLKEPLYPGTLQGDDQVLYSISADWQGPVPYEYLIGYESHGGIRSPLRPHVRDSIRRLFEAGLIDKTEI